MAKNARIRAWGEEEATGTALADCLGHQNLTKEYLVGLSASTPRRIIGIINSGMNMS
jgi:hypothetical protein